MGKIMGIIRVRCVEASMLHLTVSIKGIPGANSKPNEVEKTLKMFTRCKFCGECKAERIKLVAFTEIRI